MITIMLLALLVLVLFGVLLIMTGLVVVWPVTLALIIMIVSDIMVIKSIFKKRGE